MTTELDAFTASRAALLPADVAHQIASSATALDQGERDTRENVRLLADHGFLGFGAPGLNLTGVPTNPVVWGVVALVLVYSAYVSEVYRAGIESIHPSQEAAARSLGLTRGQALRFVILPQAVRRVIPPLLNDFIGLQKDTALVSVLGSVDALQQANINSAADFNYTPYLIAAFFFVIITIPLARFTDWLILRERRRRQAGGVA